MDKKLRNTGKYILWIAVAAVLLFFSFRGVNWRDFGAALRSCRWGYIVLAMFLGALSLFLRGLRWRMLLLPVDPSTAPATTCDAYNIGTIVNIVLPRVGEFVRCGYVTKHSATDSEGKRLASYDKVLGTVVLDRVWDVVSMLAVMLLVAGLLRERFSTFFSDTLMGGMADKARLWWVAAVGLLLAGLFVWLCWRFRERGRLWGKVWGWIQGLGEGLRSCLHMRHGWLFIVFTVLIWTCYWLMSACVMWSLQGIDPAGASPELAAALGRIDGLGLADALFLMFAGAVSSLIPVPGGFGAFHSVVAGVLSSIYGIPFGVGLVFATLSHESQILTQALCGIASYIHDTFFRR